MKIEVFKDFELIDMIYAFKELKFTRVFRGAGKIKIKLQTLDYVQSLNIDNVAMVDGEAYFIQGFTKYKNLEQVEIYDAHGVHINSILGRRTLISPYSITTGATYEQHVQNLLNQHIINPSDPNRRIPNFVFKSKGYQHRATTSYTLEKQSLQQAINTICGNASLGYKISYDDTNKRFVFELLEGVNRADEVMFSEQFNNVANSQLTRDVTKMLNVCYLNNEGVMTEYGQGVGLARRESAVEGSESSEALKQLNDNKMKENVNTDILRTEQFEYKKDWDLGDTVAFIDKRIGFVVDKPVLEVTESHGARYDLEVEFGDRIPILT